MPTLVAKTFADASNGPYFGLFYPDPRPTLFAPRTTVPIEIVVYDKAFKRKGWVGRYANLSATVSRNAVGVASFDVDIIVNDPAKAGNRIVNPRIADLMQPGSRIVMKYDGDYLISGAVESNNVQEAAGKVTFSLQSDFVKLTQMLGWPVPSAAITAQGSASTNYESTGPAETVLKDLVRVNAARLGEPITIAPDQGRGNVITIDVRMNALADKLLPVIDQAGIVIDFTQVDNGWLLDCHLPTVRPRVLSQASGIVVDSSAASSLPTLTRVVVGGQGVGTAREFVVVVNDALEAKYGTPAIPFVREGFVDARDVTTTAGLIARGQAALAAAAETYGFSITLAENNAFHYGRTIVVGDVATYAIGSTWLAEPILAQDVCRQVTITHNAGEPVVATPSLGDPNVQDPTAIIVASVKRLDKQLRKEVA